MPKHWPQKLVIIQNLKVVPDKWRLLRHKSRRSPFWMFEKLNCYFPLRPFLQTKMQTKKQKTKTKNIINSIKKLFPYKCVNQSSVKKKTLSLTIIWLPQGSARDVISKWKNTYIWLFFFICFFGGGGGRPKLTILFLLSQGTCIFCFF